MSDDKNDEIGFTVIGPTNMDPNAEVVVEFADVRNLPPEVSAVLRCIAAMLLQDYESLLSAITDIIQHGPQSSGDALVVFTTLFGHYASNHNDSNIEVVREIISIANKLYGDQNEKVSD